MSINNFLKQDKLCQLFNKNIHPDKILFQKLLHELNVDFLIYLFWKRFFFSNTVSHFDQKLHYLNADEVINVAYMSLYKKVPMPITFIRQTY